MLIRREAGGALLRMRVEAVLFDADGVVQRPTADRQAQWRALLGSADDAVGKFKSEIFAAERPCHDGRGDFLPALRQVLVKWNCVGSVDAALRAWTAIEVDRPITDLIAEVRASGVPCHLASNQEPYRARHMSDVLDYRRVFDRLFYSCELGCSKPDPDYFRVVLGALEVPPQNVLFIDDMEANVEAARGVGIRAEVFAPASPGEAVGEMQRILSRYDINVGPGS